MTVSENELKKGNEWRLKNMKKILALILTLSLAVCALALPALAEETAGAADQVSSATQNSQTGRGGRDQMPGHGRNGQMTQMPGQNGQMPDQNDQNGQMPQMPDQNDQNDQNSQTSQMPGRSNRGGKNGKNSRTEKAAKQDLFNQLLADGVITQETYDAIAAWMQAKAPQAQQDGTAPAEGSEPPALPEGEAPAEGSEPPAPPEGAPDNSAALQLLKDLLDNGTITQEQYDLLAGGVQAPPAAPET